MRAIHTGELAAASLLRGKEQVTPTPGQSRGGGAAGA